VDALVVVLRADGSIARFNRAGKVLGGDSVRAVRDR